MLSKKGRLEHRVSASVYPTPHNKIWLSSGRVPLHHNPTLLPNLNLSVYSGGMI